MKLSPILAAATLWTTLACAVSAIGQDEPNDEVLSLIIEFVKDADRETRAIGLQQIREELPGEAVTKQLVDLFPELPTDAQVELLDALADRGDAAARPLVLQLLSDENESLRLAAVRAAGALGSADDVKMLAAKINQGSDQEKQAAADALVRLRGEGINSALVTSLQQADPEVRVVLLEVLAKRNARDAMPQVKDAAVDSEPQVRLAAIRALRFLAGKDDLPALIGILKQADDDEQRYAAELALLVVCGRVGASGTEPLIAGLTDADAATQVALLRALARIGNEAALSQTVSLAEASEPVVQDEAVRLLASWKDDSLVDVLQKIAQSDKQQHRVLALRGLVRMAAPGKDNAGKVALLRQVLKMSQRIDEKRLALGALGGIATVEALELAADELQSPALSQEAALTVARIAARMGEEHKSKRDAVVQQAFKVIKNEQIRTRVDEILKSKS